MIKTIIVDDERKPREISKMLLNAYCPNVEILAEADDENSFFKMLSKHKPDLVFLDINLGSSTAFNMLDNLAGKIDFKIVFVTASEEYAIEGYKYNAIDYLLKPINVKSLIDIVNKVEKEKNKTIVREIVMDEIIQLDGGDISSLKIAVNEPSQENVFKMNNIVYLYNKNDCTVIKMFEKSEITVSRSFEYFENKLDSLNYLRIHESYIVNMDQVVKFLKEENESVLMTNNEKIPVADMYKKKLLDRINFLSI